MKFQKGMSGNPNGRPKGSNNKSKSDLQERVQQLIESNFDKLQQDFEFLEPVERIKSITNLLSYVLPKQQAISIDAQLEAEYKQLAVLLEQTPDEYIDAISDKINTLHSLSEQQSSDLCATLKKQKPFLDNNPFYDNE